MKKTVMKQKKFKIESKTLFVYRSLTGAAGWGTTTSNQTTDPTTTTSTTITSTGIFQK